MPTLRVVPGPHDESGRVSRRSEAPDDVGPAASTDARPTAASDVRADDLDLPTRWFSCSDLGVGALVRAHVLTALNALAVDTDTMADAMVLVSELVTNVRDHTDSDELGVRIRLTSTRIVIAVTEQDPTDAPRTGRLLPGPSDAASELPLHDRGRGLRILDSMAAEWGFVRRDRVTTTWFALTAAAPGATAYVPEIRRF